MDEYERFLADEEAAKRSPMRKAVEAVLDIFRGDPRRVRTRMVGDQVVALIVTSKTNVDAPKAPLVHAGVEPSATIERCSDDVLVHEGGQPVTATVVHGPLTHKCWAVHVRAGRLVRTWRNDRDGRANTCERFYAVKRDGSVKELNAIEYRRLRAVLNRSLARCPTDGDVAATRGGERTADARGEHDR